MSETSEKSSYRVTVTPSTPGKLRREYIVPGDPDEGDIKVKVRDSLAKKDKVRMFTEPINMMQQLCTENGVSFPNNILARLIIVQEHMLQEAGYGETGDESFFSDPPIGVRLPNRIALVNFTEIKRMSKDPKEKEDLIVETGIHELWHSLEYAENWEPTQEGAPQIHIPRRIGIYTQRPVPVNQISPDGEYQRFIVGLGQLHEGLIQWLTRETFKRSRKEISGTIYPPELEVVDLLIADIGLKPFLQATFTKDGFRTFTRELESTYGTGALRTLCTNIATDQILQTIKYVEGVESDSYTETLDFLRSSKSTSNKT